MRLRINEAIKRAKRNGRKVLKKDLDKILFPGVEASTRQVNMTNLCNGTTQRVKPEWVETICRVCGCSADYLFGIKNDEDEKTDENNGSGNG